MRATWDGDGDGDWVKPRGLHWANRSCEAEEEARERECEGG